MTVELMPERLRTRLEAAAPTCPLEIRIGDRTPGWTTFTESTTLQRRDFEAVGRELFHWRVQDRAGLRPLVSDLSLRPGSVVRLRTRVGPVPIRAHCRVIEVVDEADRKGFTYATLRGHPEVGIEQFVVRRGPDGSVGLTVAATSRPSSVVGFVAAGIAGRVQRRITADYLRALDHPTS